MASMLTVTRYLYDIVLYGKKRNDQSPDLESQGDTLIAEIDQLSECGLITWRGLVDLAKRCNKFAGEDLACLIQPPLTRDPWFILFSNKALYGTEGFDQVQKGNLKDWRVMDKA
jgi:hypothetical protein